MEPVGVIKSWAEGVRRGSHRVIRRACRHSAGARSVCPNHLHTWVRYLRGVQRWVLRGRGLKTLNDARGTEKEPHLLKGE